MDTLTFLADSAILVAFVSVALWGLTRSLNRRKAKKSLVRCLIIEVQYNIQRLEEFKDGRANVLEDIEALKSKLNDGLIPLSIYSDHSAIYYENISQLHNLNDSSIEKLLLFYGSLGEFYALSNGLNLPSFMTISVEGQIFTIKNLYRTCEQSIEYGNRALKDLAQLYKT